MPETDVVLKEQHRLELRRYCSFILMVIIGVLFILLFILLPSLVVHYKDITRQHRYAKEENHALFQWKKLLDSSIFSGYSVASQLEGFVLSNIRKIPSLVGPVEKRLEDQYYERFSNVAEMLLTRDKEIELVALVPGGIVSQTMPHSDRFQNVDLYARYPAILNGIINGGFMDIGGPGRSLGDNNIYVVSVVIPVFNTTEDVSKMEDKSGILDLFWGFVFVEVDIHSLIVHSDVPQRMKELGMSYVLYSVINDEYVVLASSDYSMDQDAIAKFIDTATRVEPVNTDLQLTLAISKTRKLVVLTPSILACIVCGVGTLGVMLMALAALLIACRTKTYVGTESAPKAAPFATLVIGPLQGEELWNLLPDHMTDITEALGKVLERHMRRHRGYQIPQLQPYTTTYILRTMEEAIGMAFDVIEDIQRHPLDEDMVRTLGDNGHLLLTYGVHWCCDAKVTLEPASGRLRYEGPDVLRTGRLWRRGMPSRVVVSGQGRDALVCREWRVEPLSSCVLRQGEPETALFTVTDLARPLLKAAQAEAEEGSLKMNGSAAKVLNPFSRERRRDSRTGFHHSTFPEAVPSKNSVNDDTRSPGEESRDPSDELGLVNNSLIEPRISTSLATALRTAFDEQGVTVEIGYDSVRVLVYYFYAFFKILFKPLAAPQRSNIYMRLITAFGLRQEALLENLAVNCTIRYLQQQEEANTYHRNRQKYRGYHRRMLSVGGVPEEHAFRCERGGCALRIQMLFFLIEQSVVGFLEYEPPIVFIDLSIYGSIHPYYDAFLGLSLSLFYGMMNSSFDPEENESEVGTKKNFGVFALFVRDAVESVFSVGFSLTVDGWGVASLFMFPILSTMPAAVMVSSSLFAFAQGGCYSPHRLSHNIQRDDYTFARHTYAADSIPPRRKENEAEKCLRCRTCAYIDVEWKRRCLVSEVHMHSNKPLCCPPYDISNMTTTSPTPPESLLFGCDSCLVPPTPRCLNDKKLSAVVWTFFSPPFFCVLFLPTLEEVKSYQPYSSVSSSEAVDPFATERLAKVFADTKWSPDLDVVQQCVESGADICCRVPGVHNPLLHEVIRRGHVEALRVCLTTPLAVDFTTKGLFGETVLHCLCLSHLTDEETSLMLRLVVARLQRCLADVVDWFAKNGDGMSFFSSAADAQKLSVVWPIIIDEPQIADEVDPIPLRPWVWRTDWEALTEENHAFFTLLGSDVVEADAASAALMKECWRHTPNTAAVERLVAAGANLCLSAPGVLVPILHILIETGPLECVAACMRSQQPIDFTVRDLRRRTAIHSIFSTHNARDRVEALLDLVLERTATHPEDRIDWQATDRKGHDAVSAAAGGALLSLFVSVVKRRGQEGRSMKWTGIDFQMKTKRSFNRSSNALADSCAYPGESSNTLYLREGGSFPPIQQQQQQQPQPQSLINFYRPYTLCGGLVVEELKALLPRVHGALCIYKTTTTDLLQQSAEAYWTLRNSFFFVSSSVLCVFVGEFACRGNVDCFGACLTTEHDIDFTMCQSWSQETVLHSICSASISNEDTEEMVKLIVDRLEKHPRDKINWGQKDRWGSDFIVKAARNQKLSRVWKHVRKQPYFSKLACFSIRLPIVWEWDWNALDAKDKRYFTFKDSDIAHASRSTARLIQFCWETSKPDIEGVKRCVEEGADILYHAPKMRKPLLHLLVEVGAAELVKACLTSPHPIDFTTTDQNGFTPLQCVFIDKRSAEDVHLMFTIFLDRLETHPEDTMDWGKRNKSGYDLLTMAAHSGVLSVVWPLLKERQVPFFSQQAEKEGGDIPTEWTWRKLIMYDEEQLPDQSGRICLRTKVCKADWNALTDEDRDTFSIYGFQR
eukprot:gene7069-5007_t